jgi:phosphomannomutase
LAEPIISVSGLRGIVGVSLTGEVARRYAQALALELPPGPFVVTRDGRASGPMLAAAVCDALTAIGRDVIDAGIAATPTTGVLVRQCGAMGGIQITASHNPAEYNGLKLFSTAGRVVPESLGARIVSRYRAGNSGAPASAPGTTRTLQDTIHEHWQLVAKTVDTDRIRSRGFTVVLDANHGSGSLLGQALLAGLGCNAFILGDTPDGQFAHPPEPTAENLADVLRAVPANRADIGFCQDPDADRLAIIDENGRYIGEEYTLAICVEERLRAEAGPVVTNCSTSRMSQDIAERFGVPFWRSAVGEANVVDCMLQHGAVLGGEGNGGVIDPRVGLVRDSFVAMAMVLDAMAARRAKISQIADALPQYQIVKTKMTLGSSAIEPAFAALERHFADAKVDRMDGIRLDWPGKWLLVRASNTEPIVRAIAEAPTRAEAERLCREAQQVIARIA